jgi:hypothetical protein
MKLKILILAVLIPINLLCQNPCKVLLPELDSVYTGKCKKGLAHGSGEAWGRFHYKGRFVDGYPQGEGRAEYPDGTVYEGLWNKGLRHGEGTMFWTENGRKISKTWIWENDARQKEVVPPPYRIITQRNVNRMRVYKQGSGNQMWFFPNSLGGIASEILDIQVTGNSGSETRMGAKIGYVDITYPFKGSIRYKTWNKLRTSQFEVLVEVEISDPGIWVVEIQD